MPEAVTSTSIPTPEGQPRPVDLDRFRETINELHALTMMLGGSLTQAGGSFSEEIQSGINGLFRGLAYDFEEIYAEVFAAWRPPANSSPHKRAVDRLTGTGV